MSGGSFDYLYAEDDLVPREYQIEEMADALVSYGQDAAAARRDMEAMRHAIGFAKALFARLSPVMHAVEWHHSCDFGEDQVREVCRKYAVDYNPTE